MHVEIYVISPHKIDIEQIQQLWTELYPPKIHLLKP